MSISIPAGIPIHENHMATYWFENGYLVSLSKSTLRTVDSISRNVEFVKQITNHTPQPLLIYLAPSPVPDKATRKFSTEKIPEIYTAMAMVSKPGLSKFIMNLLFGLKKPPVPMKSFSDPEAAKKWLQQFVK